MNQPKTGRIVEALRANSGRLQLYHMRKWDVSRSDVEDLLEEANCPFRVEFEVNGKPTQPTVWIVLKNGYQEPKPVDAEELKVRLNRMSYEEWLNHIDPTRRIRLSNKRGHRRTSTGADEYLNGHEKR